LEHVRIRILRLGAGNGSLNHALFLGETLAQLLIISTQRGQMMLTRVNAWHQGIHIFVFTRSYLRKDAQIECFLMWILFTSLHKHCLTICARTWQRQRKAKRAMATIFIIAIQKIIKVDCVVCERKSENLQGMRAWPVWKANWPFIKSPSIHSAHFSPTGLTLPVAHHRRGPMPFGLLTCSTQRPSPTFCVHHSPIFGHQ